VRKLAAAVAAERQLPARRLPRHNGLAAADQSAAVPVSGQQQKRGGPGGHGRHRHHARAERDHQPTVAVADFEPPGADRDRRCGVQTSVRPGQWTREPQAVLRGSVRLYR